MNENHPTPRQLEKITRITSTIYFVEGMLIIALTFRLIFRLLGANPNSGFVYMLYSITGPFVAPFSDIFPEPKVMRSVFEWSTLISMAVYAVIFMGLVKLTHLVIAPPQTSENRS